jgi:hypothetical protein
VSLRDELFARELAHETISLPVRPAELAAAERELTRAELALEQARRRGSDLTEPQARVAAAQDALAAVPFREIRIRALPVPDWEALIAVNPPTEVQLLLSWRWNPDTFRPALLAAAAVSDLTEQDWAQLITTGRLSGGELDLLFGTAVGLNERAPSVPTGKG